MPCSPTAEPAPPIPRTPAPTPATSISSPLTTDASLSLDYVAVTNSVSTLPSLWTRQPRSFSTLYVHDFRLKGRIKELNKDRLLFNNVDYTLGCTQKKLVSAKIYNLP
jgi:hypothetical protein